MITFDTVGNQYSANIFVGRVKNWNDEKLKCCLIKHYVHVCWRLFLSSLLKLVIDKEIILFKLKNLLVWISNIYRQLCQTTWFIQELSIQNSDAHDPIAFPCFFIVESFQKSDPGPRQLRPAGEFGLWICPTKPGPRQQHHPHRHVPADRGGRFHR